MIQPSKYVDGFGQSPENTMYAYRGTSLEEIRNVLVGKGEGELSPEWGHDFEYSSGFADGYAGGGAGAVMVADQRTDGKGRNIIPDPKDVVALLEPFTGRIIWERQQGFRDKDFEQRIKLGSTGPHKKDLIIIELPKDAARAVLAEGEKIPDENLGKDGREDDPHITVKYGVKDDVDTLRDTLQSIMPFSVKLVDYHVFEVSESSEGQSPIVIDAVAPELDELHGLVDKAIGNRPDDFEYEPHVTLAFVKPKFAKEYEGKTFPDDVEFTVDCVTMSRKDGTREKIYFGNAAQKFEVDLKQALKQALHKQTPHRDETFKEETNGYVTQPERQEGTRVETPLEELAPGLFIQAGTVEFVIVVSPPTPNQNLLTAGFVKGFTSDFYQKALSHPGATHLTLPEGIELANLVGFAAAIFQQEAGNYVVGSAEVLPEFQRKGLASKLYATVEKATGKKVIPSPMLTLEGQEFWKAKQTAFRNPLLTASGGDESFLIPGGGASDFPELEKEAAVATISGNNATWRGNPFVVGAASRFDGVVVEAHNFEECTEKGWHHTYIFSPQVLDSQYDPEYGDEETAGEYIIFFIDDRGQIDSMFGMPPGLGGAIREQVKIAPKPGPNPVVWNPSFGFEPSQKNVTQKEQLNTQASAITAKNQIIGQVYLLHFDKPFKHARHYLGWAEIAENRIQQHRDGTAAKLTKAIKDAGIGFQVARIWNKVDRNFERKLKNQCGLSRHCPICKAQGIDRDSLYKKKLQEQCEAVPEVAPKTPEAGPDFVEQTEIKKVTFSQLYNLLLGLRSELASDAQMAYDNWKGDNGRGLCDTIAEGMAYTINKELGHSDPYNISQDEAQIKGRATDVSDGESHFWAYVERGNEKFGIDIPYGLYESSDLGLSRIPVGGEKFFKVPGVKFSQKDVLVFPVAGPEDLPWQIIHNYLKSKRIGSLRKRAFKIEVPQSARSHFWEEPPVGHYEFWAFRSNPNILPNERLIFTFNGVPVAEATTLYTEEPGKSQCAQTGKFSDHYKVYWDPKAFAKYGAAAGPLFQYLNSVRGHLARAAQRVYDEWTQDEDNEFGGGGICDYISQEMASQVLEHGVPEGTEITEGGQDGDDHAWLVVYNRGSNEIYGVDIPPSVYETGGGYNWQKIPGVQFKPTDVDIWKLPVTVDEIEGVEHKASKTATVSALTSNGIEVARHFEYDQQFFAKDLPVLQGASFPLSKAVFVKKNFKVDSEQQETLGITGRGMDARNFSYPVSDHGS